MIIRHPLPLLTKEVPPVELSIQNTVLLMQDLHAPFADPDDGWLAKRARAKVLGREFDEYFQALALVTPNISRILTAARDLRIPAVYSCLGHFSPESPSPFQRATGWTWDLSGDEGRFPDDWAPWTGEPLFAKPAWGALASPEFAHFLSAHSVGSVILVGTMFEFGLRQTSQELADRGIGCLVVSDCAVALTQAGEKQVRGEIAHGLTKLRSTGETLALLDRLRTEEPVLL